MPDDATLRAWRSKGRKELFNTSDNPMEADSYGDGMVAVARTYEIGPAFVSLSGPEGEIDLPARIWSNIFADAVLPYLGDHQFNIIARKMQAEIRRRYPHEPLKHRAGAGLFAPRAEGVE